MRHATAYQPYDDPYPALREAMAAEYAELPPERLERVVEAVTGAPAEDLENFWSGLQRFGQQAGQVGQRALPGVVQGATTGAALGPWGALVGGLAGGALSAAGGASGARRPAAGRAAAPAAAGAAAAGAPGLAGGSPAAAQLLQLLARPELLQALMQMTLGGAGGRQVPVGQTPVPLGAFTNLLGVLSQQAAAEYHQTVAGEPAGTPLYLLDPAGEFLVDPADPQQRAEALLSRFAEADAWREEEESAAFYGEEDEGWAVESLDDERDLLELAFAEEED